VERSGRGVSGEYRNLRGQDIGDYTAPLDELFLMAPKQGLCTVAIGDGGNEVGMGSLLPEDRQHLFGNHAGSSVIPADHLIVAGVSDWGAYGLVTGISHLSGKNLLPTPRQMEEKMEAMLQAGAVDGVTGTDQASIDGMPFSVSLELLGEMQSLLN
jgi:hypothetical protein